MAEGKQWTDPERCQYFSLFLEAGAAEEWHRTPVDVRQSYPNLVNRFRARYAPPELASVYCAELHSTRQKDGESVLDCATRVQKLGKRGYPDMDAQQRECILREAFLGGLRLDLAMLVRLKAPRDLNEAVMAARQIESVGRLRPTLTEGTLAQFTGSSSKDSSKQAAITESGTLVPPQAPASLDNGTLNQITQQLTSVQHQLNNLQFNQASAPQPRSSSQPPRAGWTYDGRPICFHCNRPGHVARSCMESRRQGNDRGRSRFQPGYNGGRG